MIDHHTTEVRGSSRTRVRDRDATWIVTPGEQRRGVCSPYGLLLPCILIAMGMGFLGGYWIRLPEPAPAAVVTTVTVPATLDQAQRDQARGQALMLFAAEQARLGRTQIARLAYQEVLTRADQNNAAEARRSLAALSAQARNYEKLLNERDYQPFAEGLNGSSRNVNECHFHGQMYSCTKDEARAMFARYLVEQAISTELEINIRYPLFFWGENHANLQWGLVLAVSDVINERSEGGADAIAACFEEKKSLRPTLHHGLNLVRQICAGSKLSPKDKGLVYWRLNEAFSLLTHKEPEKTPDSMKGFLGDLKNTIALLAAYKDQIQPTEANPNTEDVF